MGRSATAKKASPRDAASKVARQRLSVLELGNVAEACRQRGMDRTNVPHRTGGSVHLTITNRSIFPHAIHLHGHRFTVLSLSGFANREGDVRDTVLAGAGETVEIAFVTDKPGQWMIHCHMLAHQHSGMMARCEVAA